jgi:hypothetical protein
MQQTVDCINCGCLSGPALAYRKPNVMRTTWAWRGEAMSLGLRRGLIQHDDDDGSAECVGCGV